MEQSKHHGTLLFTLVALLMVIVIVQSFYLYKMNKSITALCTAEHSGVRNHFQPLLPGTDDEKAFNDAWFNEMFDKNSWNPLTEIEQMQNMMNALFNRAIGKFNLSADFSDLVPSSPFAPSLDVKEEKDRYVIRVDIPGADMSNVQINVADRTVTIKGVREEQKEEKDGDVVIRRERRIGRFERTVTLPGPVKSAEMKTDYRDGILKIILPKAE